MAAYYMLKSFLFFVLCLLVVPSIHAVQVPIRPCLQGTSYSILIGTEVPLLPEVAPFVDVTPQPAVPGKAITVTFDAQKVLNLPDPGNNNIVLKASLAVGGIIPTPPTELGPLCSFTDCNHPTNPFKVSFQLTVSQFAPVGPHIINIMLATTDSSGTSITLGCGNADIAVGF